MPKSETTESQSKICRRGLSLILLLVGGSLLTIGCTAQSNNDQPAAAAQSQPADSELDVAAIALDEVERRTGIPRDQLTTDVEREDYGWSVLVIQKPETPGGFCTLTIDKHGVVTGFYGGA